MDSCPCGKDRYPWIHVCFLLQAGIGGSERCCHHPGPVKRFRYGLDPLFLGACLLYALNRWGLKPQTSLSFFHDHFNDILLIPAALPLLLWVQRLLGLRRHDEAPTRREIVGHLIVWSLLSEAVLPFFLSRATGDILDVAAYATGAFLAGSWWMVSHGRPGFDRIAPFYGWMEFFCAGNLMQKGRTAFPLPDSGNVLLAGEGHGRFLEVLLRNYPKLQITCLDQSEKMLEKARGRLRKAGLADEAVIYLCQDVLGKDLPLSAYDWIVTNYFLDCFNGVQLEEVVSRLARSARPEACWLLADFQIPGKGWKRWRARVIVRLMILFFKGMTGLKADVLENPLPLLKREGFRPCKEQEFDGGLIYTALWERKQE